MRLHFVPQRQVRPVHVLVVVHMVTTKVVADTTLPAMTRLRSYLRSSGRYGTSPFLVGHYGGLGEIAQGFCRISAVNGGVYILDKKAEKITAPLPASGGKFVVELDDFPEPLSADVLVAALDQLPMELHPPAQAVSLSIIARGIVVIDKPIPFPPLLSSGEGPSEDEAESLPAMAESADTGGPTSKSTTQPETSVEASPIDTSVIVFPPGSVKGGSSTRAAQAFTTGAGTLSAPQGKWKCLFCCIKYWSTDSCSHRCRLSLITSCRWRRS